MAHHALGLLGGTVKLSRCTILIRASMACWVVGAAMRRLTFTYSGTSRLIGRYRRVAVLLVATLLFMVGLAATPAQAATSPVVVSLTFDNEWANQMTAAQAMHAAGMPGTFYVIS